MSLAETERFRNLAKSKSGSDCWQSPLFNVMHGRNYHVNSFLQTCGDLATPCSICDKVSLLESCLDLLRFSFSVHHSLSPFHIRIFQVIILAIVPNVFFILNHLASFSSKEYFKEIIRCI